MQSAIDGARDERARRTNAVMRSVGGLGMRFGVNSAAANGASVLPTTRTDAVTATTTTEERNRADELLRGSGTTMSSNN